jgi:hypothetical protein
VLLLVVFAALAVMADGDDQEEDGDRAAATSTTQRRRSTTSQRRSTTSARPTTTTTLVAIPEASGLSLLAVVEGNNRLIDLGTGQVDWSVSSEFVVLEGGTYAERRAVDDWRVVTPGAGEFAIDGSALYLLPGGRPDEVYAFTDDSTYDRVVAGDVVEEQVELPVGYYPVRGTVRGLVASGGAGAVLIDDRQIVRRFGAEAIAASARTLAVRACADDLTCSVQVIGLNDEDHLSLPVGDAQWGAISDDGRLLALQGEMIATQVYDLESGVRRELELGSIGAVAFSADSRWLAVARDDLIEVVDLRTGESREIAVRGVVFELAFLPAEHS